MSQEISIVIINYNVKELLLDCLKSIYSKSYDFDFEVFVVDNNSIDGSCESVKNFYPQVKLIENKTNLGFPAANNQAFRLCSGNYIFMLNPDTEINGDALTVLRNYMETHQDVMLVGPQLLNSDGSLQKSVWRFPTLFDIFVESFHLHFLSKKKNYNDKDFLKPFDAESMSGAALFFRKKVFNEIGMLDENLFWIEDVDFCFRLNKAGFKMMYVPFAKVKHHIGQSAKKNYNISISNQIFNKIKFYKTHHSFIEMGIVKLISFLAVLLKIVMFSMLSVLNVVYYRKAKAYIYTLPRIFNPPTGIK